MPSRSGSMLERLARLAVSLGANVQSGQDVVLVADLEALDLARAIVRAAYERGARFVDLWLADTQTKRIRLEAAAEQTLDYVPPWLGRRYEMLADDHGASIAIEPLVSPGVLDGIDPSRAGLDNLPRVDERLAMYGARLLNRTIVPWATKPWAAAVYPELPSDEAESRLRSDLEHVLRLHEPDPVTAWEARLAELEAVAGRLSALQLDELHFTGPGTDLRIGLLPSHRWLAVRWKTRSGILHCPNLPTEEVLTVPDPDRADGAVASTMPLDLRGTVIRGLRVRFENGVAVEIDADEGADALRAATAVDEGGCRLGEVALVDDSGRIGSLGTIFRNTLLDENAACHIALGSGIAHCVDETMAARVNRSKVHIDFMIGSSDVAVTGRTIAGEETELLRRGVWRI